MRVVFKNSSATQFDAVNSHTGQEDGTLEPRTFLVASHLPPTSTSSLPSLFARVVFPDHTMDWGVGTNVYDLCTLIS